MLGHRRYGSLLSSKKGFHRYVDPRGLAFTRSLAYPTSLWGTVSALGGSKGRKVRPALSAVWHYVRGVSTNLVRISSLSWVLFCLQAV